MKDPRNLVVKTLMNTPEYREFKEACVIVDIEHGRILRKLATEWARQIKSNELASQKKEAGAGPNWSLPNPHARVNYGTTPVRLRV
jgi:hypothetical protein